MTDKRLEVLTPRVRVEIDDIRLNFLCDRPQLGMTNRDWVQETLDDIMAAAASVERDFDISERATSPSRATA